MLRFSKNNEKFYLNDLEPKWYNSINLLKLKGCRLYNEMKESFASKNFTQFFCGKGGLNWRMRVRQIL